MNDSQQQRADVIKEEEFRVEALTLTFDRTEFDLMKDYKLLNYCLSFCYSFAENIVRKFNKVIIIVVFFVLCLHVK